MRAIRPLLAALVLLTVAGPAAAVLSDVALTFTPANPTSSQSITVDLTAISVSSAFLEGVTVDGDTVTIQIDDQCRGFCVPETLDLQIDLDPLPAQTYTVRVVDAFGTQVFSTELAVVTASETTPATVRAWPLIPGDNDSVQVLASAASCGDLELLSADISDGLITVNGRLSSSGACPLAPPSPATKVDAITLGALDPGSYRIELLLQDLTASTPPPAPELVAAALFDVADAPDRADLQGGRFQVTVDWADGQGGTGVGQPVPGASDTTSLFSFFSRDNWEVMVKVLDACALNDRFWVFTAASTDVEYAIEVLDTETGERRTYRNEFGNQAPAITDTDAFATCP